MNIIYERIGERFGVSDGEIDATFPGGGVIDYRKYQHVEKTSRFDTT